MTEVKALNGFDAAIFTTGRGNNPNSNAVLRLVGCAVEDEQKETPAKSFCVYGDSILLLRDFLNEVTGLTGKGSE